MMNSSQLSSFSKARLVRNLLLATSFVLGAAQTAQAAPTRTECLEKAQADYDNAVSACWHWASDPDPYVSCLNQAAAAHQTASSKCKRIINRPPVLAPVDRPTQKAPSR